jgi:hypothetical protein
MGQEVGDDHGRSWFVGFLIWRQDTTQLHTHSFSLPTVQGKCELEGGVEEWRSGGVEEWRSGGENETEGGEGGR